MKMGLFGKDKKNEEKECCCCGCGCGSEEIEKATAEIHEGASVKVLGSGCAKCNALEANVKIAMEQLGMDVSIDHVTDFSAIAAYGVMTTPALVVNGKVVSYGKVLKVEEAVALLSKERDGE